MAINRETEFLWPSFWFILAIRRLAAAVNFIQIYWLLMIQITYIDTHQKNDVGETADKCFYIYTLLVSVTLYSIARRTVFTGTHNIQSIYHQSQMNIPL